MVVSKIDIANDKLNGWNYTYYEGKFEKLPDFDTLTPLKKGNTSGFNLQTLKQKEDYFALKYESNLDILLEGEYTFYITSDDGSRLYIDNQVVAEMDGVHGPATGVGKVTLTKGRHQIKVEYFEGNYGEELSLQYAHPVLGKQSLPLSRLYLR